MKTRASSQRGFTFIELIATISLLVILAALSVGSYRGYKAYVAKTDALNALEYTNDRVSDAKALRSLDGHTLAELLQPTATDDSLKLIDDDKYETLFTQKGVTISVLSVSMADWTGGDVSATKLGVIEHWALQAVSSDGRRFVIDQSGSEYQITSGGEWTQLNG